MQQTITNLRFALEHDVAFETSKQAIREAIDALTAPDRVKVVHGQWIGKRYNFVTYETETVPYDPLSFEDLADLTCSVCGGPALLNGQEEEVPSNYCPHCGAKMDLEEEHDARKTDN